MFQKAVESHKKGKEMTLGSNKWQLAPAVPTP
jgi:hypothetical protein